MSKFNLTNQDNERAKHILCRVCKRTYDQPTTLPCSNHICKSHLKELAKVDDNSGRNYFDCFMCKQKHYLDIDYPVNEILIYLCSQLENNYTNKYEFAKSCLENLKEQISDFVVRKSEGIKELIDCYSDLKSKLNLSRYEIIQQVNKEFNDLFEDLNKKEKDCLEETKKIFNEVDVKELKGKITKYKYDLDEYKVDLYNWIDLIEKCESSTKKIADTISNCKNKIIEYKSIEYDDDNLAKEVLNRIRNTSGQQEETINLVDNLLNPHDTSKYRLTLKDKSLEKQPRDQEKEQPQHQQPLGSSSNVNNSVQTQCDDVNMDSSLITTEIDTDQEFKPTPEYLASLVSNLSKSSNPLPANTPKKYLCRICPYSSKNFSNWRYHLENHHYRQGYLKCRYCEYYAAFKLPLKIHEMLHPEYVPLESPTPAKKSKNFNYSCGLCPYKTNNSVGFGKHSKCHTNQKGYLKCRYCHYFIKKKRQLIKHEKVHPEYVPIN